AGVVLRELDTDPLRAIALDAFRRDPYDLALDRDPVRIVHQGQQHEDFLADLVLTRGGNENATALEKGHIRSVQGGFLANVERQHARACTCDRPPCRCSCPCSLRSRHVVSRKGSDIRLAATRQRAAARADARRARVAAIASDDSERAASALPARR